MAKLRHAGGLRLLTSWIAGRQSQILEAGRAAPGAGPVPRLPQTVMLIMMQDGAGAHLLAALEEAGYAALAVTGLASAAIRLENEQPQLIIAAGACGRASCQALRRWSPAPLLVLLPQAASTGRLEMLDAGADDCQAITIGRAEVVRRVRTLLERGQPGGGP